MTKTICVECHSPVQTSHVKGSTERNRAFEAYCDCKSARDRSEKRALKSFIRFFETVEV